MEFKAETRRVLTVSNGVKIEQRDGQAGQAPVIVGHAAVFNTQTEIGEMFIEQISPGAFAETIQNDDIRCLFNHEETYVLGRNKSGTLRLSEDNVGLAIECDPPQTNLVEEMVLTPMRRGDITGMSFGFYVTEESWDYSGDKPVRTIIKAEVFEVSVVTFPAYDTTDVGVRSALSAAGIDHEALARALTRSKSGALDAADKEIVQRSIDVLAGVANKPQERQGNDDSTQARGRLAKLKLQAYLAGNE